jgi:hypothetical protein
VDAHVRPMPLVWSYSFDNDFTNCPRKAYHRYVAKDLGPYVESPEAAWGNKVHDALDRRLLNVPLPKELKTFEPYAAVLQPFIDAGQVAGERKVGMTLEGKACDFFASDVFMRGKIDVTIRSSPGHAHLLDWKTGNDRYEDPKELEGFGLMLQAQHPEIKLITGQYIWLKTGRIGITYDLTERMVDRWVKTVNLMTDIIPNLQEWPPRPSPLCAWCPVKTCEHWKERPT